MGLVAGLLAEMRSMSREHASNGHPRALFAAAGGSRSYEHKACTDVQLEGLYQ